MKFEFNSRFRNRNKENCGDFTVESAQSSNGRYTAVDPVCNSAPMYSWQCGFSGTGTVTAFSAVDVGSTELIITFAALPLIATTPNFLAGCVMSSAAFNVRIIESYVISPLVIRTIVPEYVTAAVGLAVNVDDYSTFTPLNVRAPTNFDVGQYSILYNERLNSSLNIKCCDMTTRRLVFEQASAPGWLVTDNINIRDANPSYVATILGATNNSLLLNTPITQVGDWIRLRLANYNTQAISDSWSRQIVNIDALGTTITFFPPIQVVPVAGSVVDVLPFSYDNAHPVENYELPKSAYFNVTLEALIIPNVQLVNGNLKTIPYIEVELRNETALQSYRHFINSNNPLVPESCWIAKLDPISLNQKDLKFLVCNTEQKAQTMELNIMKPFKITVKLPNGKLFEPFLDDTNMPQSSWQDLNYIAIFDFSPYK
jgi:hypothetical protein